MADPITAERLATVRTAYELSSRFEHMRLDQYGLIALNAAPDLADEVERLQARAEKAEAEAARLKTENAHLDREWKSRGARVIRLDEELRQAKDRLWEVAKTRVWTNEDGKGFVFADDLRVALDGPAAEAVSG